MKRMIVFMVVLFAAANVAYAKGYEVSKKAGDYDVTLAFDKSAPTVSDNAVAVVIKDSSGKDVKDAQVKVEYSMPAMMGMPAMNYKTDAVLRGDGYQATLGLSMSGSWNFAVKVTRGGKTTSVKFTVDAK